MGRKTEDETTPKEVKLPDFVILPFELLQADLKPNELKVLICLYSFRGRSTNTVWPTLEQIALRLGKPEKYTTEVSRIIASLRRKGYLNTSRKFGGRNNYELCLPGENSNIVENPQSSSETTSDDAGAPENTGLQEGDYSEGSNIVEITQSCEAESATTPENSNIVETLQIGENPQVNIVENLQLNIAENPQVHINKTINKPTKHNKFYKTPALHKFDFSTWPAWPSEETLQDWIAVRKGKRLALTQTAINQMAKEIHLAVANGLTVDNCLAECCSAGWAGFKYEWYCNRNKPQLQAVAGFGGRPIQSTRERSLSQDLKDTDW